MRLLFLCFVFALTLTAGMAQPRKVQPAASMTPYPEASPVSAPQPETSKAGGVIVLWGIGIIGYLIPSFIAAIRKHPNGTAICALNLFLGWTFIGWVVALVWSLTATRTRLAN